MKNNVFLVSLDNSRFDLFLAITEQHNFIEGFLLNLCYKKSSSDLYIDKINKYECNFKVNTKTKYQVPLSNVICQIARVSMDTIETRVNSEFTKLRNTSHVSRFEFDNRKKYQIILQFEQRVKTFTNTFENSLIRTNACKTTTAVNVNNRDVKLNSHRTVDSKNYCSNTSKATSTKISWIDKMTKDVNSNVVSRYELEQLLIKKDMIVLDEEPKVKKVKSDEINLSEVSILKKHGYDTSKAADKRKQALDKIVPKIVTPTYAVNFLQGQIRQKSAISNKDFSKSITAWNNDILYLKKKYKL